MFHLRKHSIIKQLLNIKITLAITIYPSIYERSQGGNLMYTTIFVTRTFSATKY